MTRLLVVARGAWGAALLIAPQRFVTSDGGEARRNVRAGARILGARQLVQAGWLLRNPQRPPPLWAIAVDLLHAASMLALAAASRSLRRDALKSAAIATAMSALSARQR